MVKITTGRALSAGFAGSVALASYAGQDATGVEAVGKALVCGVGATAGTIATIAGAMLASEAATNLIPPRNHTIGLLTGLFAFAAVSSGGVAAMQEGRKYLYSGSTQAYSNAGPAGMASIQPPRHK